MRVVFVERTGGPERHVCGVDAVNPPEGGPLAGMRLVGVSLWRSAEGEVFVSVPARSYDAGGERRFFDLLRPLEGQPASAKRAKAWILEQDGATGETAA